MTDEFDAEFGLEERLSALLDGELDAALVEQTCREWRTAGTSHGAWHAYQLIGDVLRSPDLASDAEHDRAFLRCVRERLASEPVVLAPQPLPGPTRPAVAVPPVAGADGGAPGRRGHRGWWFATSALAAGFVAVVGLTTWGEGPSRRTVAGGADPVLAGGSTPMASGPAVPAGPARGATDAVTVLRDPGLDLYLEAHQQFAGSSALGVPSGFLRSAAVVYPADR